MTTQAAKRALFNRMYAIGAHVQIRLDARRAGVVLPEPFKQDFGLALDYGFALPRPTTDCATGEDGISATLIFGGVPCDTFIPWEAVYAIVGTNEGRSWEEDVPREAAVAAMEERAAAKQAGHAAAQAAPKARHLRSVD